jgi:hypothetical protein
LKTSVNDNVKGRGAFPAPLLGALLIPFSYYLYYFAFGNLGFVYSGNIKRLQRETLNVLEAFMLGPSGKSIS